MRTFHKQKNLHYSCKVQHSNIRKYKKKNCWFNSNSYLLCVWHNTVLNSRFHTISSHQAFPIRPSLFPPDSILITVFLVTYPTLGHILLIPAIPNSHPHFPKPLFLLSVSLYIYIAPNKNILLIILPLSVQLLKFSINLCTIYSETVQKKTFFWALL